MSPAIALNAEFQSYADFQIALDAYCRQNPIANVPLAFLKQKSNKLAVNSFTGVLPLDQTTIDRFVYKNLSLVCEHHRTKCTRKEGLFCEGRITLRYVRERNVLLISSFLGLHSNHQNSMPANSLLSPRNDLLNRIFALIQQMPDDDALKLVEVICQQISSKWNGDSDGLEIRILEKTAPPPTTDETDDAGMPLIKQELLSQGVNVPNVDGTYDYSHQDGKVDQHFLATNEHDQCALNRMIIKKEH